MHACPRPPAAALLLLLLLGPPACCSAPAACRAHYTAAGPRHPWAYHATLVPQFIVICGRRSECAAAAAARWACRPAQRAPEETRSEAWRAAAPQLPLLQGKPPLLSALRHRPSGCGIANLVLASECLQQVCGLYHPDGERPLRGSSLHPAAWLHAAAWRPRFPRHCAPAHGCAAGASRPPAAPCRGPLQTAARSRPTSGPSSWAARWCCWRSSRTWAAATPSPPPAPPSSFSTPSPPWRWPARRVSCGGAWDAGAAAAAAVGGRRGMGAQTCSACQPCPCMRCPPCRPRPALTPAIAAM